MNIRDPFETSDFFPELTPLIDMMFLLMIFFMLTATFIKETEHKAIPIEIPEARHSEAVTTEHAVVITVNENGNFMIDDRPCTAETLADVLKIRTVSDSTIIISAHKKAPYLSIVYIYDVLQSLGIRRFAHDVK